MIEINECIFLMNKFGDMAEDHFTKDLAYSTTKYRKIKIKAEKKKAKKKAKKENANY